MLGLTRKLPGAPTQVLKSVRRAIRGAILETNNINVHIRHRETVLYHSHEQESHIVL